MIRKQLIPADDFDSNSNVFQIRSFLRRVYFPCCRTAVKSGRQVVIQQSKPSLNGLLKLEHLTYNKSKHGWREKGWGREAIEQGKRERKERERGLSQCVLTPYSHYPTLLQTRRSLSAQVGDANQSFNFKLYLRDQPGDLRARRVSLCAIGDHITSKADFEQAKERGSWDLRESCFHCLPPHVNSRSHFALNTFPLQLIFSFFFFTSSF